MARGSVHICRSRDNMGYRWFDLYDADRDLHTSYTTFAEAQAEARNLSAESGAFMDLSCHDEANVTYRDVK